ncbi:hypothetical protein [Pedobacter panaciterrae]
MKSKIALYITSFGVQFFLTLAVSIVTVRYYAPTVAVEMFYNLNVVTFLSLFISLGIPQALIRYQYLPDINKVTLNQMIGCFGIITTLLTIAVSFIITGQKSVLLVLILPFTISQYYLRSIENFRKFIWLNLGRLLLILVGSLFVYFFNTKDDLYWYLVVGGSYAIGIIYYPKISSFTWDKELFKELLKYSVPLQLYTFLLQGVFLLGQTVLNKFGIKTDFQEYVMTWRVIQIIQGVSALVFFFFPQFYFKNIEKNKATVLKYQKLIIIGLIGISLCLIAAKPLLDIVLKYNFSYVLLAILLCAETLRLSAGILNTKYSYYMKNRYLLWMLFFSIMVMLLFWAGIYFRYHLLTAINVSVGLLLCFFTYFITTYVKLKTIGNNSLNKSLE